MAALVEDNVMDDGVPNIIVPDVVKLVKSIPAPLLTAVTVPVFVVYPWAVTHCREAY